MCPGLARIVVKYLKENLTERNVLLVLQHICLYCNNSSPKSIPPTLGMVDLDVAVTQPPQASTSRAFAASAPPFEDEDDLEVEPLLYRGSTSSTTVTEDDLRDFETGMAADNGSGLNCCSALMKDCLELIDSEASAVLESEDLEDVDVSALKMIVCRETLRLKSEVEVFTALMRWSSRECKRQRLELSVDNRRKVLEGAQYLVRYLTLDRDEFVRSCALLSEEEQDALMSAICENSTAKTIVMPDHLSEWQGIMRTKRRGRPLINNEKRPKGFRRLKKQATSTTTSTAASKVELAASAEKDKRRMNELKERSKEKFNLIEEFFICLACIFD